MPEGFPCIPAALFPDGRVAPSPPRRSAIQFAQVGQDENRVARDSSKVRADVIVVEYRRKSA